MLGVGVEVPAFCTAAVGASNAPLCVASLLLEFGVVARAIVPKDASSALLSTNSMLSGLVPDTVRVGSIVTMYVIPSRVVRLSSGNPFGCGIEPTNAGKPNAMTTSLL